MVIDVSRDELRGMYKAINSTKRELTLKAIDEAALDRPKSAVAILGQVLVYTKLENQFLDLLRETKEDVVDIIDDVELLTPVDLGRILKVSENQINKRLTDAGLQTPFSVNGYVHYKLTAAGKKYGVHIEYKREYTSLRWHPDVIDIIKK